MYNASAKEKSEMLNNTTVTFVGNLVGDPDLSFTPTGKAVCKLRVLVSRRMKDSAGEWVDGEPTGYNVEVWEQAAENAAESLMSGMSVFVHGTEHTEAWAKDGEKKTRRVVRPDAFGPELHRASATVRKNARRTSQADQSDPWAEPA